MSKLYGTLFDGRGGSSRGSDHLLSATVQNRADALRVNVNDAGAVSVGIGPSTIAADATVRATWMFLHADLATLAAVAPDERFYQDVAAVYDAAVQRLGATRPSQASPTR